jgi:hypothetical protein
LIFFQPESTGISGEMNVYGFSGKRHILLQLGRKHFRPDVLLTTN